MIQPAKMVRRGGHLVWRCPCCDQVLGEVYGDRVTVKAGERLIIFPVTEAVQQICPKCGATSTARNGVAA